MPGIMADNDIQGHFERLRQVLAADWDTTWEAQGFTIETFESLGLTRADPDRRVWEVCQSRQVVLITGNRNQEDPNSLEATLRDSNTVASLPVVTIGDLDALLHDKSYAARATAKLLEYLLELEQRRGAGRLYIP